MVGMEEQKEVINIDELEKDNIVNDEQGFSMAYNLTIVSAIATVVMFVIGTALYLTVVG